MRTPEDSEITGGVRRFEDLIAWQRARELVGAIYRSTRSGEFASDRGLKWQLQRAGVSIMSNIAEGFERSGPNDFHNFLRIAEGSAGEVRSLLIVAMDVGYLTEPEYRRLDDLASETSRIVGGLPRAVERQMENAQGSGLSTQHSGLRTSQPASPLSTRHSALSTPQGAHR